MTRYRLEPVESLALQMGFVPAAVRDRQIAAAEELLGAIEPDKAYPIEFIIFRITGYHPAVESSALLAGIALQHDLGLLIEAVSLTLDQRTDDRDEPVLSIDDLCRTFNVTSKTLQRWRRRGLAARRFIFADGKRRVGFRLAVVERFLAAHGPSVRRTINASEIQTNEFATIIRQAKRLSTHGRCDVDEICRRIARRTNRSPLTIDATLRKFDTEHPADAILPSAASPIGADDRERVLRLLDGGQSIRAAARAVGRPSQAVYAVVITLRLSRLVKRRVHFFDDALYHEPDAQQALDAMVRQEELPAEDAVEKTRVPGDLPAYLRSLFRYPLLSAGRERSLFLSFNFAKFLFASACCRLDPAKARARDIDHLERLRARYTEIRNRIAQANLRLVVSVASKHIRAGVMLMELVSEGNIVLLRAIEGFDTHKGNRFSTYATLALMKGFARSAPQMQHAARLLQGDDKRLDSFSSRCERPWERLALRDEADRIFRQLAAPERNAAAARFDFAALEPR